MALTNGLSAYYRLPSMELIFITRTCEPTEQTDHGLGHYIVYSFWNDATRGLLPLGKCKKAVD